MNASNDRQQTCAFGQAGQQDRKPAQAIANAARDEATLGQSKANLARDEAQARYQEAQATRYGDTVSLFQALGGGWWNRKEVAAK